MSATLHPRRVSGSRRRSSGGSSHTLDILAGLSSGSSATSLPSPPASPRHMPQPGVISEEGADLAAKTSPTTSPKTTRASLRKLSRSSATSVGSVGSVPHSTAPLTTSPLSPRKAASSTSKLASLQRDEAASHSDSDVAAANKQALLNGESSDKFLDDVASPLPTFTTNERGQLVAQVPAGGAAPNLQRRKSSGDTSLSGSRLLVSDKPGTTTTAAAAAAAAAAADPASPVKRAGRLSNSGPGVSLSSVTPFVPLLRGDHNARPTLEQIIADPSLLTVFTHFAEQHFCSENVSFFVAVQHMRSAAHAPKMMAEMGDVICREFIRLQSPQEINITSKARQSSLERSLAGEWTPEVFREAEKEVHRILSLDTVGRFLTSAAYRNWKADALGTPRPAMSSSTNSLPSLLTPAHVPDVAVASVEQGDANDKSGKRFGLFGRKK